jgi:predicted ATPase
MVDLSPVSDPQLVAVAIADAIGAGRGAEADEAAVLSHLEGRAALVVIDNCEHVLETTGRLAATMLRHCPQIAILATSRVPLSCPGEHVWRIQPLSVIDESVDLFYDRARSHLIDGLGQGDRETVVQICGDLDGMPLAIELAAARLAVLSPAEILAGLRHRFRLLRGPLGTAVPGAGRSRHLAAS